MAMLNTPRWYINFDYEDPQYTKSSRISELIINHKLDVYLNILGQHRFIIISQFKKKQFWDVPHFRTNRIYWKSMEISWKHLSPQMTTRRLLVFGRLFLPPPKNTEGLAFHSLVWNVPCTRSSHSLLSMENLPGSSGPGLRKPWVKRGPFWGATVTSIHWSIHRKDEIRLSATEPEEIGRWA